MKTISKIKLNQLVDRNLDHREMNELRGGSNCICGCRYAGSGGGSSNSSNGGANNSYGYYSPGGGTWYP